MEMQSKPRVELRLKVKILYKMSNWAKDSGWSRKKKRAETLGHHTVLWLMRAVQNHKAVLHVKNSFLYLKYEWW